MSPVDLRIRGMTCGMTERDRPGGGVFSVHRGVASVLVERLGDSRGALVMRRSRVRFPQAAQTLGGSEKKITLPSRAKAAEGRGVVGGCDEAVAVAVGDVDVAGVRPDAFVLEARGRHADGEVDAIVAVEVAGGQGGRARTESSDFGIVDVKAMPPGRQ
jgi:hypothetical protein